MIFLVVFLLVMIVSAFLANLVVNPFGLDYYQNPMMMLAGGLVTFFISMIIFGILSKLGGSEDE